jgi:hypothetical protein
MEVALSASRLQQTCFVHRSSMHALSVSGHSKFRGSCPRLRSLPLSITILAHVGYLAILSRHRCGHCRGRPVRAHKATSVPRLDVRSMALLRAVALPELQNISQEEPAELVAFAVNNLPQMRTRSNQALMVDL